MGKRGNQSKKNFSQDEQRDLFDTSEFSNSSNSKEKNKKLRLENKEQNQSHQEEKPIEVIPSLVLPTRWEYLQPKLASDDVSLLTIIRPVPQALSVIRSIISYLRTTSGCQVLVIRAGTGGGKTTFLNTLHHYIKEVKLYPQTIEIQNLSEEEFSRKLWSIKTFSEGINLIVLEGREKPESISDKYIQNVLADINRFARSKRVALLFVIPTIEDEVARNWCNHGNIGDLIPEGKLFDGSR